jgi:hypothetical protein
VILKIVPKATIRKFTNESDNEHEQKCDVAVGKICRISKKNFKSIFSVTRQAKYLKTICEFTGKKYWFIFIDLQTKYSSSDLIHLSFSVTICPNPNLAKSSSYLLEVRYELYTKYIAEYIRS